MNGFSFAPIFGNGMVLQRDEPIKIWGKDGDGTEVFVFLGNEMKQCKPQNGYWECIFSPLPAGKIITVTAAQANSVIKLDNILLGDVWIAGGQSNMEFFMRYEKHWNETKNLEFNSMIRMYTCPRQCFNGQEIYQSDVGTWFEDGDWRRETFSAPGYYFARYLQPAIGVPIGIVSCNWGGTSASAWLPEEELIEEPLAIYLQDYASALSQHTYEEFKKMSDAGWKLQKAEFHKADWAKVMYGLSREEQLERMLRCANNPVVPMGPYNKNRPGCLYENMLKPISGLAVKGVIWYQGENDVHHSNLYSELFEKMIVAWRKLFKADIPFLFVQLAPFDKWMALDGEYFPEIRAQQEKVSNESADCYMTTTGDIGDSIDIHPKEKSEIGRRLALMAEEKIYGMDVCGMPPKLIRATTEGCNTIVLSFSNPCEGMYIEGDIVNDLYITEENNPVGIERCTANGNNVLVRCDDLHLDNNILIELGQSEYSIINVYNSKGIPVCPFKNYRVESHHV